MKKILLIGLGGIAGACLRFGIKGMSFFGAEGLLPFHTAAANLLACFLIGCIAGLGLDRHTLGADIRLALVTGFLGALSTFSTVCRETWMLLVSGHVATALAYVAASLALGLLTVHMGAVAAGHLPWARTHKEET